MKSKHLVAVVPAVSLFAGIVISRAEQPHKVTTVQINLGGETNIPPGRILGFSCVSVGPQGAVSICYALVDGAK
jgi:hypothetical protein